MSETDKKDEIQVELLGKIIKSLMSGNRIKVHTCFNLTVPGNWGFKNRINSDFHIVYIKGGQGCYHLPDDQILFEKGKIIFVGTGTLHSALQNAENPPQIIPVRFGIYDMKTNLPIDCSLIPFSIAYRPKEFEEFRLLFEKVYQGYIQRSAWHMGLLCDSVLTEILIRIYDELMTSGEKGISDYRIEKVRRYIEQNPLYRMTNDELAEMAGLTEKYFRELFKQQTGFTPKEYQIRNRIYYARFLLEEGAESVKSVAIATGYPDPYTFSKQFKKVVGFSPCSLVKKSYKDL